MPVPKDEALYMMAVEHASAVALMGKLKSSKIIQKLPIRPTAICLLLLSTILTICSIRSNNRKTPFHGYHPILCPTRSLAAPQKLSGGSSAANASAACVELYTNGQAAEIVEVPSGLQLLSNDQELTNLLSQLRSAAAARWSLALARRLTLIALNHTTPGGAFKTPYPLTASQSQHPKGWSFLTSSFNLFSSQLPSKDLNCSQDSSLPVSFQARFLYAVTVSSNTTAFPNTVLQLLRVLSLLPPGGAYVSIHYTRDLADSMRRNIDFWIDLLQLLLVPLGIPNKLAVSVRPPHPLALHAASAQARNALLAPFFPAWSKSGAANRNQEQQQLPCSAGKQRKLAMCFKPQYIVFLDNVYFCACDMIRLMEYPQQLVCGVQFEEARQSSSGFERRKLVAEQQQRQQQQHRVQDEQHQQQRLQEKVEGLPAQQQLQVQQQTAQLDSRSRQQDEQGNQQQQRDGQHRYHPHYSVAEELGMGKQSSRWQRVVPQGKHRLGARGGATFSQQEGLLQTAPAVALPGLPGGFGSQSSSSRTAVATAAILPAVAAAAAARQLAQARDPAPLLLDVPMKFHMEGVTAAYDATRDMNGKPLTRYPPYVSHAPSAGVAKAGLPLPMYCCWGGLAKMSAEAFNRGLRFRGPFVDEWPSSETSLMCDDLHQMGLGQVVLDPGVRTSSNYSTQAMFHRDKFPFFYYTKWESTAWFDVHPMMPLGYWGGVMKGLFGNGDELLRFKTPKRVTRCTTPAGKPRPDMLVDCQEQAVGWGAKNYTEMFMNGCKDVAGGAEAANTFELKDFC